MQFLPASAMTPSTTNGARFTTRGTPTPHRLMAFDNSTDQSAAVSGVLLGDYADAGLTVVVRVAASGVTSGVVKFQGAFEAGADDMDADSFATAVASSEVTVSGVDGVVVDVSIVFTNSEIDGITAGGDFRFLLTRLNSGLTGTNAAAAALVRSIKIHETGV